METARHIATSLGSHPVPEGTEPKLTPMGLAIKRFGVPLPRAVLYACNVCTPKQAEQMRLEAKRADAARRAAAARDVRLGYDAIRFEAGRLWDAPDRGTGMARDAGEPGPP